ncbi:cell division site-positioning protein MapZ family protein [Streptococcus saliviloxodontae]|uniref:Mid-cell-anchored protein Z n=1 Tax=Streptococcus saliviloxodontae TaxID=1349416 RepID=A0ABS2PN59_9STRE|nr:cell division site-positioning protein MapZ family protein [Streptococcus saliviloxodontae]MBM7636794.1 hypothetical protein [Streptococcus saliviloxodontae]
MTKENDNLDFEKAKDMTVEEAVQKSEDLKAGITEDDSVLDKYIKKNREQVEAQKFENTDISSLDTASLDNFIKKQREELAATGLLDSNLGSSVSIEEEPEFSQIIEETQPVNEDASVASQGQEVSEGSEELSSVSKESILLGEQDDTPVYKNKKLIFGSLIGLIVAIFATAFGLNALNTTKQTASSTTSSSSVSKTSTTSSSSSDKANNQAFETLYDSFYTDTNKTALKNSQFSQLSELETALKKLKNTNYYTAAKKKYDSLKNQITAIQTVNGLFEAEAIVDGSYNSSVPVKVGANFDGLPSSVLNTGNASTDTLIQTAITGGRGLLTSTTTQTQVAETTASTSQATTQASPTTASTSTDTGTATTGQASTVTSYGITNYNPATLERSRSRVPYNDALIADSSNPAWAFGEGILEKIVATSQARGYISGNNYILEPVNIINGNGYYNMFKPDGTYLFSINAKTGYYVGNASGHSDALDY